MSGGITPFKGIFNLSPKLREQYFFPLESAFNEFFDKFFKNDAGLSSAKARVGYPKMDVFEEPLPDGRGKQLVAEAALPGVKYEDIEVEVVDEKKEFCAQFGFDDSESVKVLVIKAKSETRNTGEGSLHYIKELKRGSIERRVALPNGIKDEPSATWQNGVLRLVWEIEDQEAKPVKKSIPIKRLD
jgi:HSP20 family molecular chaperone IbpA